MTDLLPIEKPKYTVSHPTIPFRKVMNGILYVLRTECQWKILPKKYGASTCNRWFHQWVQLDIQKDMGSLLGEYDNKKDIKWIW